MTEANFAKWVVLKEEAATNFRSGPKYLKHALVRSVQDTNPCSNANWWSSNVSSLSDDKFNVISSVSSLCIDYPAASGIDTVSLIEGDTFGTDEDASWRDGLCLNFYVSDASRLDTEFGYFYFGNESAGFVYKWYLSTLNTNAGFVSGWNSLFLQFMFADELLYTASVDPYATTDPRIISNVELKSIGLVFRGKGDAFKMNIDGVILKRNRFYDTTYFNKGLYLNKAENLTASIGNFDLTHATLEFFIKPDYQPSGMDIFFVSKQRNLFNFVSGANDIFGAYVFSNYLGIYYGNLGQTPQVFLIPIDNLWSPNDVLHFAVVASCDGTGMDNGNSIRFYVNNTLMDFISETWDILDPKHFEFSLGGPSPYAVRTVTNTPASSIDAVISNLKIYNYCKTDFSDSLAGVEVGAFGLKKPSELIEISKDNLTFYNIRSSELPFVFKDVPAGDTVTVYVKTVIPKGLTGKERRTSGIIASWNVGV